MTEITEEFNANAQKLVKELFYACKIGYSLRAREITQVFNDAENADKYKLCNAGVNSKDEYGNSPLHEAVYVGYADTVRVLLDAGADIEAKNNVGETPIFSASYRDNAAAARLLIKAGADINARDNKDNTPLHTAAYWGSEELVKLYVKAGADLEAVNKFGNTPVNETSYMCNIAAEDIIKKAIVRKNTSPKPAI